MKPELRTALAVTVVSAAVTSLHTFNVRVGPLYWLLNLALMTVGVWAGALMIGSVLLKMSGALLGLVLGLMLVAHVMTSRDPNNNLFPLALAITFVVSLVCLWLGTAVGDFLQRRRRSPNKGAPPESTGLS